MKKNKHLIKYLLLIMLVLVPIMVFASDESSKSEEIMFAIAMEAFVSIHMSVFVLSPLSKMLAKENSKKTFWTLFAIRAGVLLFCDIFVTTAIAFIDFVSIFIGAFIVVPIVSVITKTPINARDNSVIHNVEELNDEQTASEPKGNIILKCTKCGNTLQPTDKVCQSCGTAFEGNNVQVIQDTSPVVQLDSKYVASEQTILRNIIIEEIKAQGENEKTLSTSSLNIKKNILLAVYGILLFICVILFYFNYSFVLCSTAGIIGLFIYLSISKKFNVIDVLVKQAKQNPDEDIANIIRSITAQKYDTMLPSSAKLIIVILICIILPSLFFITPKILYQKVGDGYYVLRYTRGLIEPKNEIVVPKEHKGKPVLGIQENAFKNTNIAKINLPYGLESIKTKAFYNCNKLVEVTIPSTVTEIRASAFENNTSLVTVNLSEGVTDIRGSAFKNCTSLKNIKLPDSLEYLGAEAFSHTAITEITIPRKVVEINGGAFAYCPNLTTVNLHDDIISIHGETFMYDTSLTNIILPSKITEIRGNTFEGCTSLTYIDIPEGVTRIGGHAFYGCSSLSQVIIPSTIIEIGSSAFRQCYSLYNVRVPYNAYINERAFKESPTSINRY